MEQNQNIIPKLKAIQGQPLKYCQLCDSLGIERKGTKGKIAQLKNLQMYCDFEILDKPTRYLINDVYENEIKAFAKVNGNNKYQIMFDAVIYQAFLENHGSPIYLSNTDMLRLFAEVNENFIYASNGEQMCQLGEDYIVFSAMSQVARKILARWTQSRLTNMHNRKLLVKSTAYRLYTLHKGEYGYFRIGHNVPADSELGKRCMAVIAQAYDETIPKYLKNESWLPGPIYNELNDKIKSLTRNEFNNEYFDLKEIVVLLPPKEEWITSKLTEIYKALPALHEINEEACRKILTTKQLDKFTGEDRKRFIEVNLKPNPAISLKQELKNIKNERRANNE